MIIYGLGNNEEKYLNTKHNIGRVFVEKIAHKLGLSFKKVIVKNGECFFYAKMNDLYLVYSDNYMNTSGLPLNNFIKYFKLEIKDIFVIQDDSDQNIFKHKLLLGGGNAGHNGIKSIHNTLNIKDFYRLKIGIRPIENKLKSEHFVLSRFEKGEVEYTQKIVDCFVDNLNVFSENESKFQTLINSIHKQ